MTPAQVGQQLGAAYVLTGTCLLYTSVYERDLGPDTVKIAASIQEYNPTDDWSHVE